ncbi:Wall-associated receptor kinase galacturonan-binding domain [Macleaya cordata]|uniref:RING-type E3 ubiquitin transferase n=1 Tax=Macleaya cordata TaxID=56857 RepID=A0A200QLG8_MACCD|nr:Wall-associated receptor kinase galacturonan-binding domain [Macleaya cordata]
MGTLKVVWFSSFMILFFLFFPHITSTAISTGKCVNSTSCGGVEIRFPFCLKDWQPKHCCYPGFELSCTNNNETVLDLPFSGRFFIRYIDYKYQDIVISDPADCLPRRLLDFNLSDSPFKRDKIEVYGNHYTFFNCSRDIPVSNKYKTINCLSSSSTTYKVISFPTDASAGWLLSPNAGNCKPLGTVSVPRQYDDTYYLEINYLDLTWNKPDCSECESQGQKCRFKNYNSSDLAIGCFGIPTTPLYLQGIISSFTRPLTTLRIIS